MGKKSAGRVPKTKCCVSKDKCGSCPLRMLKEGTLPPAYGVKKRRLVHAETMRPVAKSELTKPGGKKQKKGKRAAKGLPVAA